MAEEFPEHVTQLIIFFSSSHSFYVNAPLLRHTTIHHNTTATIHPQPLPQPRISTRTAPTTPNCPPPHIPLPIPPDSYLGLRNSKRNTGIANPSFTTANLTVARRTSTRSSPRPSRSASQPRTRTTRTTPTRSRGRSIMTLRRASLPAMPLDRAPRVSGGSFSPLSGYFWHA